MSRQEDSYEEMWEMDRKAVNFLWEDIDADMQQLQYFAKQEHPDGKFTYIKSFKEPPPDDPNGDFRIEISPVIFNWLNWLQEKYDRETTLLIHAKFCQMLCGEEGLEDVPREHNRTGFVHQFQRL